MSSPQREISPRIYITYIFGALLLGAILFFYEMHLNNQTLINATPFSSSFSISTTSVSQTQNIQPLSLVFATTSAEQELGLGQRASLPSNKGMLFVFPQPGNYGFWMKDMDFSIDMIWMDSNFMITHIESDVSPQTYPESFYPKQNSLYVLETNAGYSKNNNLSVGETLDFVKNSLQNTQ